MITICIVGDLQDLSAAYISWLAARAGVEVLPLSEDKLGIEWTFGFFETDARQGTVSVGGKKYSFSDLDGAFVRFNPRPSIPPSLDLSVEEEGVFISERRTGIAHFLSCLPCIVANRPTSGRSNGSKAYQMQLLSELGFAVPDWMLCNEQTYAKDFLNQYGKVIYKSCSGLRSRVRLVDENFLARLQDGTCPAIIQPYIEGRDVRIHVVGKRVFSTEVISTRVDYRFDSRGNEFRATMAPSNIEELCRKFSDLEDLILSGFDFRVTPEGHWYCLEANPVPTFLPYEMETGQPIGKAILDLFINHKS
jgi:glutathione synthase/RimK-type ligase-like ATP-grasp enzyme